MIPLISNAKNDPHTYPNPDIQYPNDDCKAQNVYNRYHIQLHTSKHNQG